MMGMREDGWRTNGRRPGAAKIAPFKTARQASVASPKFPHKNEGEKAKATAGPSTRCARSATAKKSPRDEREPSARGGTDASGPPTAAASYTPCRCSRDTRMWFMAPVVAVGHAHTNGSKTRMHHAACSLTAVHLAQIGCAQAQGKVFRPLFISSQQAGRTAHLALRLGRQRCDARRPNRGRGLDANCVRKLRRCEPFAKVVIVSVGGIGHPDKPGGGSPEG